MPFASTPWATTPVNVKKVSQATHTTGALIWMSAEVNPAVLGHVAQTRSEATPANALLEGQAILTIVKDVRQICLRGQEPAKLILVAEMLCAKTVQMELIVAFVRKATRVILFEDASTLMNAVAAL
jgi:hypothetical protein